MVRKIKKKGVLTRSGYEWKIGLTLFLSIVLVTAGVNIFLTNHNGGSWLTGAVVGLNSIRITANPTNNSYIGDIFFYASQTVYTVGERIEVKGWLYLTNYSNNGTLLANHSGLVNASVNVSMINKNTNVTSASYSLNTSSSGDFYSRSDYYSTAPLVSAPSTTGDYYVRVAYTDPNSTEWWTQNEIRIINQTVDKLYVSSDKLTYSAGEAMILTVEAVRIVGDDVTYVANVTINGSIRDSSKTIINSFNCTTGDTGKCTLSATASSSYGEYWIEVSNFKGFSLFVVEPFKVNLRMKDELGETIKHVFDTSDTASVETGVITNSTSEMYTFNGIIRNSGGTVVKSISSTNLNGSNSYINRFTFTLDALNFPVGNYFVDINVTKTGGGVVEASTSFEIRGWNLILNKKEASSGFEYGYSTFPSRVLAFEIYPKSMNGTIISDINTSTSLNISVIDGFSNSLSTANASWNGSCGSGGCYEFSVTAPSTPGEYYVKTVVSSGNAIQTVTQAINIISATMSSQSTDKEGTIKDLFGTNEFVYLSLSGKNTTSAVNLSSATVVSVTYMNGSEISYTSVNNFDRVNSSNDLAEYAWNSSQQRIKMDTPKVGGVYIVHLSADNNTAATSARFIVNPYDSCVVAKNTPGSVTSGGGSASGYYYVYQFKTTDTIYFELKLTQANNPTGRASFENGSNASSGMGSRCVVDTNTKSVVSNATITISEVVNTQTGKEFSLNTTESVCNADDNQGGYTCTIKSIGNWDGGSYGAKLVIVGPDGQTSDFVYAMFEARAFYLNAWSQNYQNKPNGNLSLTAQMYEAGNNWWGGGGSGGLSGTVEVKKIEYQGSEGEWLSPPIDYAYNISQLNTTTITSGQGTLSLPAAYAPTGTWKTGYYRAVLKGTDSAGNVDYGYAWFGIKRWETWASPVECSGTSCTSVQYLNSRSNVSLYTTINNAGEWGQSGRSLGGNVTIRVKKIQDCRKWPCTELNSSSYSSTSITVSNSSGWYWGTIDNRYIINITPTSGTWGTGYWQAVFDVNNTESGSGWFNTIAFYVETQPTDINGINWKYNIRNAQPSYVKVKTVKSQKSGWYYNGYNASDFVNTSISAAVLRAWDQSTWRSLEYTYPTQINISVVGGGTLLNGSSIINVTYGNGSWPSGYYWGELTLNNSAGETATGYMWFNVQPFRVQISSNIYSVEKDTCINGSVYIYDPDWNSNSVEAGNYTISSVTEQNWNGFTNIPTTYTNFTPTGVFNGSANFTICPNNGRWSSGSWGGYHYLTVRVSDSSGNVQDGWLSFRTVPFQISWGSVSGNQQLTANVVVPVSITKSSGANTTGNLSRVYQWRNDNWRSRKEEYNFTVGSCNGGSGRSCMINGTQNVTILAPSGNWKEGYNYLQAEWTDTTSTTSTVSDYSGIYFNAVGVYNGWFSNVDANGNWKYNFGLGENITTRLEVRDANNAAATVNITSVEYSTPSMTCWDDYCRTYNTATWNLIGGGTEITGSGIINIAKPATNWTKGYVYLRVTVRGALGTVVIKNGNVWVKDLTPPTVTMVAPSVSQRINVSTFDTNWTTSESSTCWLQLINFGSFYSWFCQNSWYNISTQSYCNNSAYTGTTYYYDYVGKDYHSWYQNSTLYGWSSGATGLSTGGTTHYYQYTLPNITQDYGIQVYCNDEDWNYGYGWTTIKANFTG